MIIASLVISPLDKGVSVGDYVKEAIRIIDESGLNYRVCSMSTEVEAESLDSIFEIVKRADERLIEMGSKRVSILVKIDHRTDKDARMESKIERATGF